MVSQTSQSQKTQTEEENSFSEQNTIEYGEELLKTLKEQQDTSFVPPKQIPKNDVKTENENSYKKTPDLPIIESSLSLVKKQFFCNVSDQSGLFETLSKQAPENNIKTKKEDLHKMVLEFPIIDNSLFILNKSVERGLYHTFYYYYI